MIFQTEEILVKADFVRTFNDKRNTAQKELRLLEKIIASSGGKIKNNQYRKYAAVMLAGLNLKGFVTMLDRTEKGYLSDAESVLKKNIESFLAQVYFYEHPQKAKEWCLEKLKLGNIEINRFKLAKRLDEINKRKKIFPTNEKKFFQDYIYDVGYKNANAISHMDFATVHREIGVDNENPLKFATIMMLGPKFDKKVAEIVLNRTLMFMLFQITFIKKVVGFRAYKEYKEIFKEVFNYFV